MKVKDAVNLYSSWGEVIVRVPQDSALDCMMLKLFLVVEESDFTSYENDKLWFHNSEFIENRITPIKIHSTSCKRLFQWFSDNQMSVNTKILHLLVRNYEPVKTQSDESSIKNTTCKNFLVLELITKLDLKIPQNNLLECKK